MHALLHKWTDGRLRRGQVLAAGAAAPPGRRHRRLVRGLAIRPRFLLTAQTFDSMHAGRMGICTSALVLCAIKQWYAQMSRTCWLLRSYSSSLYSLLSCSSSSNPFPSPFSSDCACPPSKLWYQRATITVSFRGVPGCRGPRQPTSCTCMAVEDMDVQAAHCTGRQGGAACAAAGAAATSARCRACCHQPQLLPQLAGGPAARVAQLAAGQTWRLAPCQQQQLV